MFSSLASDGCCVARRLSILPINATIETCVCSRTCTGTSTTIRVPCERCCSVHCEWCYWRQADVYRQLWEKLGPLIARDDDVAPPLCRNDLSAMITHQSDHLTSPHSPPIPVVRLQTWRLHSRRTHTVRVIADTWMTQLVHRQTRSAAPMARHDMQPSNSESFRKEVHRPYIGHMNGPCPAQSAPNAVAAALHGADNRN